MKQIKLWHQDCGPMKIYYELDGRACVFEIFVIAGRYWEYAYTGTIYANGTCSFTGDNLRNPVEIRAWSNAISACYVLAAQEIENFDPHSPTYHMPEGCEFSD